MELGSLYYDLTIDDKNLNKQLDSADKNVKSFGDSVSKSGENLKANLNKAAVGMGVVGASLTLIAKNATDFTVETVKGATALGRTIGVTTEEASKLTAAFSRMGITAEAAQQMFGIFSKQIVAAAKATGEADNAFVKLGISVKDAQGVQKSFNTLLFEVADRFKTLPNGVDKTTLAMELFGRSGKDMIKVLNLGSEGIKDLENQAEKLGLTLTSQNIAAVNDYVKSQKDLKASTDALKIAIGTTTAPVLAQFNQGLNDVALKLLESDGIVKTLTVNVLAFGGPIAGAAAGVLAFAANLVTAWPAIVATTAGMWGMATAVIAATWPFILLGVVVAGTAYLIITNWNSVWGFLQSVFNWIRGNWGALLTFLVNPFAAAHGIILATMNGIRAGIINFFHDAPGWLYNAGRSVIDGFINGIRSKLGEAVSAVKNVGDATKNGIKSLLGIRSPSKVFEGIGENVTQGFIKGMTNNMDIAGNMLNNLSAGIIRPQMNMSTAGVNTGAGNNTSYGDTVVNIGQINNDQDEAYVLRRLDRNQFNRSRGGSPL